MIVILSLFRRPAPALVAGVLLVSVLGVHAQEPPKRPWSDTAEFAFISTTGNSESFNIAFTNKYVYKWTKSEFTFDAAALRTDSTTRTVTNDGATVTTSETETTTAETYSAAVQYRREFTERFFWYGRGAWLRNQPAGIDSRTSGGAGLGYRFIKSDIQNFVGEFGVNYTDEQVVDGTTSSYAEARGFLGYDRKLSETSKLETELELLDNLDTTSDWRANFKISVTASLTSKLALKAGYRVLYDNEPVQELIPDTVAPLGGPSLPFEHDKTDTVLSASLVINF